MKKLFRIFLSVSSILVLSLASTPAVSAQSQNNNPFANDPVVRYNNDIIFVGGENCTPVAANTTVDSAASGGDYEKTAWQFFMDPTKNLKDYQVAGIMGNLEHESGIEPQRLQGTASGVVTRSDSLSPAQLADTKLGWGVVQFTNPGKFINPTKAAGKDPDSLVVQLDFVWDQLLGKGPIPEDIRVLREIRETPNIEEAVKAFQGTEGAGGRYRGYERPGDQAGSVPDRTAQARIFLEKYKNLGGTASSSSTPGISGNDCTCSIAASPAAVGKVVVIDPGHSGATVEETDPATGIKASDYKNPGTEMKDMWETSQLVKTKLEEAGFTVVLTKESQDDSVGLLKRAKIANDANAAIAVSLHSTPGNFGNSSVGWVTPQEVGLYRQTGSNKKTFEDENLAETSQSYANKIVEARKKAEGDARIHRLDFSDRGLPATGDISIVQLFSKVPWVYNEVGQTGFNKNKYAEGVSKGIIGALGSADEPLQTGEASKCGDNVEVTGELSQVVKAYAWPKSYPAPYLKRTQAWAKVADNPKSHYVGGSVAGVRGIDCGGFVTMVMRNSGYDPGYNPGKGPTGGSRTAIGSQWHYLDGAWEEFRVNSTEDLKDAGIAVAINSKHTFLYVGQIEGFGDIFASASYSPPESGTRYARAPMAGQGDAMTGGYTWYRKK